MEPAAESRPVNGRRPVKPAGLEGKTPAAGAPFVLSPNRDEGGLKAAA